MPVGDVSSLAAALRAALCNQDLRARLLRQGAKSLAASPGSCRTPASVRLGGRAGFVPRGGGRAGPVVSTPSGTSSGYVGRVSYSGMSNATARTGAAQVAACELPGGPAELGTKLADVAADEPNDHLQPAAPAAGLGRLTRSSTSFHEQRVAVPASTVHVAVTGAAAIELSALIG